MPQTGVAAEQVFLAQIKIEVPGVSPFLLNDVTPMEVVLAESLLTPGLQTFVRVHSAYQSYPLKNLDEYKGKTIKITMEKQILKEFGITHKMEVSQKVFRLSDRKLMNNNIEEFLIHACDITQLNDAATLVSKMWKCTTPSKVVRDVLTSCAGVSKLEVEGSTPARDYVAENIHPFQVVNQQAQVALANDNDPSFLHYMTYENLGTHHFKSLYSLTKQNSIITYKFSEVGLQAGYSNPRLIMTHSFPCDFDLLSDILNGIDEKGNDINSVAIFNPLTKSFHLFGNQTIGCGIGGGVSKVAMSNVGSSQDQNACPDYTSAYLQKRQARMGLLEQDKIALRITVPWNPELHAGKIIRIELNNKLDPTQLNYGSGDYLIVSMTHNLKYGGFSTTTMDCVSKTVGRGIV